MSWWVYTPLAADIAKTGPCERCHLPLEEHLWQCMACKTKRDPKAVLAPGNIKTFRIHGWQDHPRGPATSQALCYCPQRAIDAFMATQQVASADVVVQPGLAATTDEDTGQLPLLGIGPAAVAPAPVAPVRPVMPPRAAPPQRAAPPPSSDRCSCVVSCPGCTSGSWCGRPPDPAGKGRCIICAVLGTGIVAVPLAVASPVAAAPPSVIVQPVLTRKGSAAPTSPATAGVQPIEAPCRDNYAHVRPCGLTGDDMTCACGCTAEGAYCGADAGLEAP
jgi:hypothetical protein